MTKKKLAVIGGDRRMAYAAVRLTKEGFAVSSFALPAHGESLLREKTLGDALSGASLVVLPVPMSKDERSLFAPAAEAPILLDDIFASAPADALIFGGMTAGLHDPRLCNYAKRDDFAMRGAVPTAEGALLLAIQHLPCTLAGAEVAILGFGRIGKATASLFRSAGARVTVFARREESVAVAALLGYESAFLEELPEHAGEFRCLVNTIPAKVVGDMALSRMPRDIVILELASAPFGIDQNEAAAQGLDVIGGGGLPGKYAPETAGEAVAQTVLAMLSEKNLR